MKIFAVVAAFVGVSVATSVPKYATSLFVVIGLLVFVEPVWRLDWRRRSKNPGISDAHSIWTRFRA